MVGRGTAPARVLQRVAERIEGLSTVVGLIDGVPARAEAGTGALAKRVGDLVALVPQVEDMAVAMRRHPRPVVDRLGGGQERPVEVERHLTESGHRPAREGDVPDVRVDEIEVARVVESHVAFIAEVVLLE